MSSESNYIGGIWETPPGDLPSSVRHNPARREQQLYTLRWDTTIVAQAAAAAREAQRGWERLGFDGRLPYLERLAAIFTTRREELARAIALEAGKPLWEARGEAGALAAKIGVMATEGAAFTRPVHPDGLAGGSWNYRALGVLAVLGPFNFPLHLPNGHIVPALLSGNTVIVKPSELTSGAMSLYFRCLEEAGFPPGVVNLVHGGGELGAALVASRDIDGVLFTGSWETGLRIRRATIDHPGKLLALEMGGKNTSIVCDDANLEQAVHEIAQAAYLTTGQRCSATSRVVVHHSVADAFTEAFVALSARVTCGDPLTEDAFMGPLVDERAYQKFLSAQQDDEGGKLQPLLVGGSARDDLDGCFVKPAVWRARELDPHGSHQSDEIFGPDVVIYTARSDEEAARIANATEYGLAMSVFTADEDRFGDFVYDLRAGIVNQNRSTCGASSRLPFGGVKKSGNNRPAAILAGLYCTYPQAYLQNEAAWDASQLGVAPLSLLDGA